MVPIPSSTRPNTRSIREVNSQVIRPGHCGQGSPRHGQYLVGGTDVSDRTLEERFWSKVDKNGKGSCWLWTASLSGDGYGRFRLDGSIQRAHRVSYSLLVAPVPNDRELDHLCRVRNCVNPDHLEPVTSGDNVRRGTESRTGNSVEGRSSVPSELEHCPHRHPYDEANTLITKRGWRVCRTCNRIRMTSKGRLNAEFEVLPEVNGDCGER